MSENTFSHLDASGKANMVDISEKDITARTAIAEATICHPLALSKVSIELTPEREHSRVRIQALCKLKGKTGVEMEALTAASVAALTIYDMCKAVDKTMVISQLRVLEKQGGKSGNWRVA